MMVITEPTVLTFYFIGVTTSQSSSLRVFPRWSQMLHLETEIAGVDVPIGAPAGVYRALVSHIKAHPLVRGALITTHKIDLFNAARDLIDELDPYAQLCGEVSCLVKRDGKLIGIAKDPVSSGFAWREFIPAEHFACSGSDVLCLGSGGAAVAISTYLAGAPDRPRRFTLVDISKKRLNHARAIHQRIDTDICFEYMLNGQAAVNDRMMAALPGGSVVINATGMGKDLPGSPVSDSGQFPQNGFAWELNYRGELRFLQQARRQTEARLLQ
ncbi:MAG: shikimate dehydrogenase, partial [Anaerolineae bacterium]|nr:shikimate dehydrogenase [Anaerolineae bacterium]